MDLAHFLEHPIFKPYHKRFKPGQYLFKQGSMGDTMFIILEGKIHLLSESEHGEFCIAVMGAGQFLGERALVSVDPYQRRFSVRAATEVMVMELGHTDIINIEKQAPYIKKMILTRSLEVAEERLDRANNLVTVLRPKETRDRILRLIEYFSHSIGSHDKQGVRFHRLSENIAFYVEDSAGETSTILKELLQNGILIQDKEGDYILPSLEALSQYIETGGSTSLLKVAA